MPKSHGKPGRVGKNIGWVDEWVGKRIRGLRLATGISQEKLGEACGISFQQVQKYEKGSNRVSVSRLRDIALALHVDMVELLPPMDRPKRVPDKFVFEVPAHAGA